MNDDTRSLQESRRLGKIDQFAKERPSTGNEQTFDALLTAMASGKPKTKDRTSDGASGED